MNKILISALAAIIPLAGYAGSYSFSSTSTGLESMTHGTASTWALTGSQYTSLLTDVKTNNLSVTSATLTISKIWDWTNETNDPADALFIHLLSGLNTANSGVNTAVFDATLAGKNSTSFATVVDPFISGNSYDTALHTAGLAFNNASANTLLKYTGSYTKAGTPTGVSWSDPNGGAQIRTGYPAGFDLVITLTGANLTAFQALLMSDTNGASSPDVGLGFGPECHYYDSGMGFTVTTGSVPSVPDATSSLALVALSLVAVAGFRRSSKNSA